MCFQSTRSLSRTVPRVVNGLTPASTSSAVAVSAGFSSAAIFAFHSAFCAAVGRCDVLPDPALELQVVRQLLLDERAGCGKIQPDHPGEQLVEAAVRPGLPLRRQRAERVQQRLDPQPRQVRDLEQPGLARS